MTCPVIICSSLIVTQKAGKFQGVCIWFECTFPSADDNSPTVLSTNPACAATHWKQTVVVLPENSVMELEAGEAVAFHLIMKRNEEDARRYVSIVQWDFNSLE